MTTSQTPEEMVAEIRRLLNIDEHGEVRGLAPVWMIYVWFGLFMLGVTWGAFRLIAWVTA